MCGSLRFEQIDWACGRIVLSGKGRRESPVTRCHRRWGDALLRLARERASAEWTTPHVFLR